MQRILTLILPFPVTIQIGFSIFRFGTTGPSDIDIHRLIGLVGASLLAAVFAWAVFRGCFEGHTKFWTMLPISIFMVLCAVAFSGPVVWIVEALASGLDFEATPIWVFPVFGTLGLIPFLPTILGLHVATFALDSLQRRTTANKTRLDNPR